MWRQHKEGRTSMNKKSNVLNTDLSNEDHTITLPKKEIVNASQLVDYVSQNFSDKELEFVEADTLIRCMNANGYSIAVHNGILYQVTSDCSGNIMKQNTTSLYEICLNCAAWNDERLMLAKSSRLGAMKLTSFLKKDVRFLETLTTSDILDSMVMRFRTSNPKRIFKSNNNRQKLIWADKGFEILDQLFAKLQRNNYVATQDMLDDAWKQWCEIPDAFVLRKDAHSSLYVSTNIGYVPLTEYREIQAQQYGYDSYSDMLAAGSLMDIK